MATRIYYDGNVISIRVGPNRTETSVVKLLINN